MSYSIVPLLPCLPRQRAIGARGTVALGDERRQYDLFIRNVDQRRLDASVLVVHTTMAGYMCCALASRRMGDARASEAFESRTDHSLNYPSGFRFAAMLSIRSPTIPQPRLPSTRFELRAAYYLQTTHFPAKRIKHSRAGEPVNGKLFASLRVLRTLDGTSRAP
jgi:hypothetical protein